MKSTIHSKPARALLILWGMLMVLAPARTSGQIPLPPELDRPRDGDMVAWIGDTFVEREPSYAYLETWLTTRFPNRAFRMRNLGWSADTVKCESRARFGTAKDGFEHLVNTLAVVKPTIVVLQYGTNDSQAGAAGLQEFLSDYRRLISEIRGRFKPRQLFLATPMPPARLLSATADAARKKNLDLYAEAIRNLAPEVQAEVIDFNTAAARIAARNEEEFRKISDNGVNLSNLGYWRLLSTIDRDIFGFSEKPLKFRLTQDRDSVVTIPASQSSIAFEFQTKPGTSSARFEIRRVQLPAPVAPRASGDDRPGPAPGWMFQFPGLADGRYRLELDGKPAATASAKAWAEGISVGEDPDAARVEQIRQHVMRKNELFFHRWRPQNETYLFGFR
ncbi:MAG: GDSL-type esterase/lipase family protein, partial [Isosphaeraceae bacterium]